MAIEQNMILQESAGRSAEELVWAEEEEVFLDMHSKVDRSKERHTGQASVKYSPVKDVCPATAAWNSCTLEIPGAEVLELE